MAMPLPMRAAALSASRSSWLNIRQDGLQGARPAGIQVSSFMGSSLDLGKAGLPSHSHSGGQQLQGQRLFRVEAKKRTGFAKLLQELQSPAPAPAEKNQRVLLRPHKVSPPRIVPPGILRPPYADTGRQPPWMEEAQVQTAAGVEGMRAAGALAARVRDAAGELVKPGVTTDAIDEFVHTMIVEAGAYPSPLNYGGFPKSVCTSVNECICHGIPDARPLVEGDIINIDVTVYLNGYHGDCSATFFCGTVSPEAKKLVEVTRDSLEAAISLCGPGVEFKRIGAAIQDLADKHNYGVVRHFVGHGVGKVFHSGPAVLHFRNDQRGKMVPWQTFTIEPMLTVGDIEDKMWDDKWTYVTADGSLSAQFEHTLLITDTGVEVLTR